MNPFTLFLILGLLVAVWWLVRKRREGSRQTSSSQLRPKTANTQFHAVSISYASRACDAAKNMTGRRFLATAAPKLPLPECDILECSCRFVHHEDRRIHKDRRSPFSPGGSTGGTGSFNTEQRAGSDRRHRQD
jgi:hypothetical protein